MFVAKNVVGAGPAGLFAALRLIELGLKPIVIERGKDVRGRRRDLKAINVDHVVNEDSNCFGEAGTYSDEKYTRSKKEEM
jgi:flavin-dependent dehydrogenase